jgi:hypothetical protein
MPRKNAVVERVFLKVGDEKKCNASGSKARNVMDVSLERRERK